MKSEDELKAASIAWSVKHVGNDPSNSYERKVAFEAFNAGARWEKEQAVERLQKTLKGENPPQYCDTCGSEMLGGECGGDCREQWPEDRSCDI